MLRQYQKLAERAPGRGEEVREKRNRAPGLIEPVILYCRDSQSREEGKNRERAGGRSRGKDEALCGKRREKIRKESGVKGL